MLTLIPYTALVGLSSHFDQVKQKIVSTIYGGMMQMRIPEVVRRAVLIPVLFAFRSI